MAISKGFIQCPERHCSEVAEVLQASGKRSTLYTKCPACGTNQGNGVARQKFLAANLKVSIEDVKPELEKAAVSDTQETAAIPSKNEALEVSDDTYKKPVDIPSDKPKGIDEVPSSPPALLAVLAIITTLIAAIFATKKPKGKTA